MAVRQISVEVYHQIREEGLLSRMRMQVYDALFKVGPVTATQLLETLRVGANTTHSNVRARLLELRELGCAKELGTTTCPVTGREVILWDVTAHLPKGYQKPLTKLEAARRRIKELEAENASLKRQLSKWGRPSSEKRSIEARQERLFCE